MTAEAFRFGIIPEDPWKRVPLFVASSKPRDTLSLEEARTLLDPATVDTIWKGHRLYWLINMTALMDFANWDGYLFSFSNGETPCTGNRVTDALYAALSEIGITDADRRERNIVFHSWRKFLNTWLRSQNVSDAKIQAVTRHATQEMTEYYTGFKVEDFSEVARAQEVLFGKVTLNKGYLPKY